MPSTTLGELLPGSGTPLRVSESSTGVEVALMPAVATTQPFFERQLLPTCKTTARGDAIDVDDLVEALGQDVAKVDQQASALGVADCNDGISAQAVEYCLGVPDVRSPAIELSAIRVAVTAMIPADDAISVASQERRKHIEGARKIGTSVSK